MVNKYQTKGIKANIAVPKLKELHTEGSGHEFWVNRTTNFTEEDQNVLIEHLLTESKE